VAPSLRPPSSRPQEFPGGITNGADWYYINGGMQVGGWGEAAVLPCPEGAGPRLRAPGALTSRGLG
jgi:hypothetical protein